MGAIKRAFANNITTGGNLDSLDATKLTDTLADARFPATLPAISGANLTGIGSGLNFITSATPSGSSSILEMQSCFSATYQNYIVIMTGMDINTNNSDMGFRMMSGSSEHTGTDYYWSIGTSNRHGTGVNESGGASNNGRLLSNTSNDQDTINLWNLVTNPQVTSVKTCWASMGGDRYEGSAGAHSQYGYTWVNSGSSFDGFSFRSVSGHNFRGTGKIMVFGLSDS